MTRHPAALLILLLALALLPAVPAAADDYADPDYLAYDLDAMARTQGRQVAQATDPVGYGLPFIGAGIDTFISDAGQAVNDLRAGRIYGGGGRWIPGGSAGDPRFYYDVSMTEIAFTARTGAKLLGHVWAPIDAPPGPRPGVVITSIRAVALPVLRKQCLIPRGPITPQPVRATTSAKKSVSRMVEFKSRICCTGFSSSTRRPSAVWV